MMNGTSMPILRSSKSVRGNDSYVFELFLFKLPPSKSQIDDIWFSNNSPFVADSKILSNLAKQFR